MCVSVHASVCGVLVLGVSVCDVFCLSVCVKLFVCAFREGQGNWYIK